MTFRGNRLLAGLPRQLRDLVLQKAAQVDLVRGEIIVEAGDGIGSVVFPDDAVISSVALLDSVGPVELATTGCEGVAPPLVVLGAKKAAHRAIVQVPGRGVVIGLAHYRDLCSAEPVFQEQMVAFARAFAAQALQSVACNGVHSVEERCARWLLMTHDRVGRDTFALTQEFLAEMLGVSRAAVNLVARTYQQAGIIRYTRGDLTILDRLALEDSTCECYSFIRQVFASNLPSAFRH